MQPYYKILKPQRPEEIKPDENSLYQMPDEWYFNGPGISKSELDLINEAPLKFKEHEYRDTPEMMLGRAIHCAILEPEAFNKKFAIAPSVDRRTKAGKEAYQEFMEYAQFKEILTSDQALTVEELQQTFGSTDHYGAFVKNSITEVSCYAKIYGNILSRGRVDAINKDGYVIDIKTTKDAKRPYFRRSLTNFRYHVQAAYYLDILTEATGIAHDVFVLIVIERAKPYLHKTYVFSEEAIDRGREEYLSNLKTYEQCMKTDQWPGYDSAIEIIEPY